MAVRSALSTLWNTVPFWSPWCWTDKTTWQSEFSCFIPGSLALKKTKKKLENTETAVSWTSKNRPWRKRKKEKQTKPKIKPNANKLEINFFNLKHDKMMDWCHGFWKFAISCVLVKLESSWLHSLLMNNIYFLNCTRSTKKLCNDWLLLLIQSLLPFSLLLQDEANYYWRLRWGFLWFSSVRLVECGVMQAGNWSWLSISPGFRLSTGPWMALQSSGFPGAAWSFGTGKSTRYLCL